MRTYLPVITQDQDIIITSAFVRWAIPGRREVPSAAALMPRICRQTSNPKAEAGNPIDLPPRQQHHKNGNSTPRWWPTTKRNVRVIALRHVHPVSPVQALTKHSVYVRNLEERIKPGELIDALKELFSEYGEIIDVVAKTNLKAKGQAFVVFDNVESAQKCIEDVQGFDLFGKPMQLAFAKTRSDAFVKRTAGDEELESHKRRRLAEKGMWFLYLEELGVG